MKNSYQEKILEKYRSFEAVKDRFTISRIQSEISALVQSDAFNKGPRRELEKKYEELDKILAKYPDAVQ